MSRRALVLATLLTLGASTLAAGCQDAPAGLSMALRRSAAPGASAATPQPSPSVAPALAFVVNAPAQLAGEASLIQGDALSAGQAGVIAVGAGHVIAIGAGHYRLQADTAAAPAIDGFRGVSQAFVRLEDAAGKALSDDFPTDEQGRVTLGGELGEDGPVFAVARFMVGGKAYRLAVPVRRDSTGTVYLDPINTMLSAAFRAAVAADPARALPSAAVLRKTWDLCNEGGVTVSLADLEQAKTWDQIKAIYQSLATQLPAGPKRAFVSGFMDATDGDVATLDASAAEE